MKQEVTLAIEGRQTYQDQEPEIIELVTEGTLEYVDMGWDLSYEESALTGLEGVTTHFAIRGDTITLTRTGKIHSEMVFKKGIVHNSLYELEFGALMLSVCATELNYQLSDCGGEINLVYNIDIEQTTAGQIEYHLDIHSI